MIYSIVGIDKEDNKVIPIYFTTDKTNAKKWFDSISVEKEFRGFQAVKLLIEIDSVEWYPQRHFIEVPLLIVIW